MGETRTIDLPDGWRATSEEAAGWLCLRLHPPTGGGQFGLAEGLWNEARDRGASQVVVEMDEVSFLPSAVMGELVRLHKRLAIAGGRMRVSGLQEHPREAYRSLRLDELIPVYGSRDEACEG